MNNPSRQDLIAALQPVLISSFEEVHKLHNSLGSDGTKEDKLNQFNERALRLDWEAEEVFIEHFKQTGHSFKLISEEHGNLTFGDKPLFTLVIDGVDGTLEYKKNRGTGMYGSMAGVLYGTNPKYDDYLTCGFVIHSPELEYYYAEKGRGCFLKKDETEFSLSDIITPKNAADSTVSKLNYPPEIEAKINSNLLNTLPGRFMTSMCADYARMLKGEINFFIDFTRKQNLEQVIAYGLLKEAGGDITTLNGQSIGQKLYLEFGQKDHLALINCPNTNFLPSIMQLVSAS